MHSLRLAVVLPVAAVVLCFGGCSATITRAATETILLRIEGRASTVAGGTPIAAAVVTLGQGGHFSIPRQLLAIHGVGPKAIRILRDSLADRGLAFAPD